MDTNQQNSVLHWPAPVEPPGTLRALRLVTGLSLRQFLFSRRTLLLGLLAALPLLLAVAVVGTQRLRPGANLPVNSPVLIYQAVYTFYYTHVLLLLVPLLYAIGLVADEVEQKTLTCLLTRPVGKATLLLGKLLAYLLVVSTVLGLSLVACYVVLHAPGGTADLAAEARHLLQDLAVLLAGLLVYGAIFALIGLTLKRAVLAALIYALVWESVFAYVPGLFHKLTVLHYLQANSRIASEREWLLKLLREITPPAQAAWTLAGVLVAAFVAAVLVFRHREYQFQEPAA